MEVVVAASSPQRFFNEQLKNTTTNTNNNKGKDNFEFDFSGHLERPSLSVSADKLFHGGKIRPLNPTANNNASSTKKNTAQIAIEDKKDSEILVADQHLISSKSRWSQNKNHLWRLVTGSSNKSDGYRSIQHNQLKEANKGTRNQEQKRGRQRNSSSSSYNNDIKDKYVSSLISKTVISTATSMYCDSFLSSIWFTKGYRKWRVKNFLLFRSASEGTGADNDPLRKYSILSKTTAYRDIGNCSFRSTDESSGYVSRRRVSAHELYYTATRAASEELKKKTLLPYKHGLLGCFRFNTSSGMQYISTKMGSLERS